MMEAGNHDPCPRCKAVHEWYVGPGPAGEIVITKREYQRLLSDRALGMLATLKTYRRCRGNVAPTACEPEDLALLVQCEHCDARLLPRGVASHTLVRHPLVLLRARAR